LALGRKDVWDNAAAAPAGAWGRLVPSIPSCSLIPSSTKFDNQFNYDVLYWRYVKRTIGFNHSFDKFSLDHFPITILFNQ
jgi:hypothetical protein